jgi:hypothetical protein
MTVESDGQFGIEKAKAMGLRLRLRRVAWFRGHGTAFERMRMAKMIP